MFDTIVTESLLDVIALPFALTLLLNTGDGSSLWTSRIQP